MGVLDHALKQPEFQSLEKVRYSDITILIFKDVIVLDMNEKKIVSDNPSTTVCFEPTLQKFLEKYLNLMVKKKRMFWYSSLIGLEEERLSDSDFNLLIAHNFVHFWSKMLGGYQNYFTADNFKIPAFIQSRKNMAARHVCPNSFFFFIF